MFGIKDIEREAAVFGEETILKQETTLSPWKARTREAKAIWQAANDEVRQRTGIIEIQKAFPPGSNPKWHGRSSRRKLFASCPRRTVAPACSFRLSQLQKLDAHRLRYFELCSRRLKLARLGISGVRYDVVRIPIGDEHKTAVRR